MLFLLSVLDIFSKYAWVVPLKDKGTTINNTFQNVLNKSECKPKKIWVDKGSQFYNKSLKSWLEKNDVEMYSAHSVAVAEAFIRTLKNKIYKYMTSLSKNVYIDKLDDMGHITYIKHRT